jgi:hypothetical protein
MDSLIDVFNSLTIVGRMLIEQLMNEGEAKSLESQYPTLFISIVCHYH